MLTSLALLQNFWLKNILCFLATYLIGFFSIKKYITFVNKKGLFQPIRSDGPETHKAKKKTPTMGGIFIVLASALSTVIFAEINNPYILTTIFVFISFAAIGLADDLMKVIYKNPQGFRGSFKIIIQFIIVGLAYLHLSGIDYFHMKSSIFLPFSDGIWIVIPKIIYIVFITFVIVGSSNAVNLTDGLDGLVSVPAIINILCLGTMIFIASDSNLSAKYFIHNVENSKELLVFCSALIGGILSFLAFNLKPAKIFMGDVGSLAIGSVLGLMAIIIKQEIVFFVISLVFVAEAVSVILQVGSYKLRKKRIFLMAPLHHHFEKLGWGEKKVVKSFWAASLVFAALGMAIFLF
jgi:phospho-N-acetylmuramoyl-pentapeptide-transferase